LSPYPTQAIVSRTTLLVRLGLALIALSYIHLSPPRADLAPTARHPLYVSWRQPCQKEICDLCTFVYRPVCDSKPVATPQLFVVSHHQLVRTNTPTNQSVAIISSSMHRAYVTGPPSVHVQAHLPLPL